MVVEASDVVVEIMEGEVDDEVKDSEDAEGRVVEVGDIV